MTDLTSDDLRGMAFMQSRIPPLDGLTAFVPDDRPLDPAIQSAADAAGFSRWYPLEGGHRLVLLYEGGPYDATRFTVEPGAWDHEHCHLCYANIPSMTLCWVTRHDPYVILCEKCYGEAFNQPPPA
jgi:hypothetical protein